MFPRYVEIVQCKKVIIPPFVRLEVFDDSLIGSRKPLYLFYSLVSGISESGNVFPDGKINVFRSRCAIALGKCDRKNIQTAPDAMKDNASFGVDYGRDEFHIAEANNLLPGLRIQITKESVRGIIEPSVNLRLQDWEIGYGPIDSGLSV
jgi:hypothetical protein